MVEDAPEAFGVEDRDQPISRITSIFNKMDPTTALYTLDFVL